MEQRQLGRTGLVVSAIGLGMEHAERSAESMEELLATAVAGGISYIDTLYGDPDERDITFWEVFAPALAKQRDKLLVSGHWSDWRFDLDACERRFEHLLERSGGRVEVAIVPMVDYVEALHGPVAETLRRLERFKREGRVGAIGMSGHVPEVALEAVQSGRLDVLMYPVNLVKHDSEPDQALYQACLEQGVGLIAMKPFYGGTLLVAQGKPTGITPWQCLDYVLAQPVSTTVPGARNAEQVRGVLSYLEASQEERDYRPAQANLHTRLAGICVFCNHCLPCPSGIDIANTLMLADWAKGGMMLEDVRASYGNLPAKASDCSECGECSARCPFGVDVASKMQEAAAIFASS